MKVDLVSNHNLNRKQTVFENKKYQNITSSPVYGKYPIGYIPHQISFGAIKLADIEQLKELANLPDLPCIYCGKKMIPQNAFNSIAKLPESVPKSVSEFVRSLKTIDKPISKYDSEILEKISLYSKSQPNESMKNVIKNFEKNKIIVPEIVKENMLRPITQAENTKNIINIVKRYQETLPPVERAVFEEIKSYRANHPNATLQKTMVDLRPHHIEKLISEQNKVLDDIDKLTENLSETSKEKILQITKRTRDVLIDGNGKKPFKRKEFIKNIYTTTAGIEETKIAQAIETKASSLPSSANSVDAFIIKYSGKISTEDTADKLEEIILPAEKKMYDELAKQLEDSHSGMTIEKAIKDLYPSHVKKLSEAHQLIIGEISDNFKAASNYIKFAVNKSVQNIIELREDKRYRNRPSYLRTTLINSIRNDLDGVINDAEVEKFVKIAEGMPCAKNGTNDIIPLIIEKPKAARRQNYALTPDTIQRIYPEIHKIMRNSQDKTLTRLLNKANFLAKDFEADFAELTNNFEYMNIQEQKAVIDKLRKLNKHFIKKNYEVLLEPLNRLPNSNNNLSAFVAKYGNRPQFNSDIVNNKALRSDREIGERLLEPARISIEHIKPQVDFRAKNNLDGKDDISNLSLADARCNSYRQSGIVSKDFEQHIQAQVDYIIEKINDGTLKKCNDYPAMLKKAYYRESNGKINLDISKLKLKDLVEVN